jgi:hypothetical protein
MLWPGDGAGRTMGADWLACLDWRSEERRRRRG